MGACVRLRAHDSKLAAAVYWASKQRITIRACNDAGCVARALTMYRSFQ